MKQHYCNQLHNYVLFIIILFLLGLIIYQLLNHSSPKMTEGFVPRIIKEQYRPLERFVRMGYHGFYRKTTGQVSNLFKKIGIW